MTKDNKVKLQMLRINLIFVAVLILIVFAMIITYHEGYNSCATCFEESLASKVFHYTIGLFSIAYITFIPIAIYKIRQSRKNEVSESEDDNSDEGSSSY